MTNQERLHIEKTILITMLESEAAFNEILTFGIDKDLFASKECKSTFQLIDLYFTLNKKQPNGIPALYEFAISHNDVNKSFLLSFSAQETNQDYIKLIQTLLDDNCKRSLLTLAQKVNQSELPGIDLAYQMNEDITSFIYSHFKKYLPQESNPETALRVIRNIRDIMEGKTNDYIPTGFKDLDKKIIGFHRQSVSTIAARPGMGKTAFLLQVRRNLTSAGYKIGVLSLEMDKESLFVRDLSARTLINSMNIETGKITSEEYSTLQNEAGLLAKEDYLIDDSPNHSVKSAITLMNKWKLQNSIDLVFIDYLTLFKSFENNFKRYDLVIAEMTEKLRVFAKETNTAIVILSQLNRESEKRIDKRPQLSDLRESGSIEQDSRLVMFLYRPFYYGIDYTKEEHHKDLYTSEQKIISPNEYLEVIIAKNRSGQVGRTSLQYKREVHTFHNLYSLEELDVF